jgi:hypothetical protein
LWDGIVARVNSNGTKPEAAQVGLGKLGQGDALGAFRGGNATRSDPVAGLSSNEAAPVNCAPNSTPSISSELDPEAVMTLGKFFELLDRWESEQRSDAI